MLFRVEIVSLCVCGPVILIIVFLAHLSLMGELIVCQSLRRPFLRPHFQTSSLKPLGQLKLKFHMETP